MAEYLFSWRPFVGYNRSYFPVPSSLAITRNNATVLNAEVLNFIDYW